MKNVSVKTDGICKNWLECICENFKIDEGYDFKKAWFAGIEYLKTYGLKKQDSDIISNFVTN